MKEKQAAVLECLAHIAYETQPGIVLETVAAALRTVLDAEEVCFYEWHGSWLPLWPQESAQPLPLQGALLLHERGEAFFQDDGWNGVLALPGAQQAEGAVWARRMAGCPGEQAKELAHTLCTAAAPKLTALFRHCQSGAPLREDGLAAVSHEVRTPLAVALSAVELLRAKLKKEDAAVFHTEYEPYFVHLEHSLNRTLRLAQNMVEMARFEAGTDEYAQKTGSIRQALQALIEQAGLWAAGYGVALVLMPGPDICGMYQPEPFEHVVLNLLTNAVRHSPQGDGHVQIELWQEERNARTVCMVRVLDNGPGIAPEMQAHLFEKYRAGLNGPHGAGLGLYLSMGLARKMFPALVRHSPFLFPFRRRKRLPLPAKRGLTGRRNLPSVWLWNSAPCPHRRRAGRLSGHPSFHFQRPVRHGRAARAARLFLWKKTAVCALL